MTERGSERWARIDELYYAALERPEAQRDEFLSAACEGNEQLRREIRSLLRFHDAEGFLDKSPAEIARRLEAASSELASSSPQSGQIVSHYRIIETLGAGGMGVVYRAEDLNLDRTVALKFLLPDPIDDPARTERLIREAKAAASLDHQNVCTVYEIGETDDGIFLAMALVEGERLSDRIAKRPLKLAEALDIAIQTAQGLQSAHEKGVVHRDIKSSNLMINRQGQVKIMDFGIAQLASQERLTRTSTIVGSPGYLSPEQAQGQKADARSDIWSLGIVLYEMVTGRLPFEAGQRDALLHSIIYDEHEPATALRVGLPTELDRILAKILAKDPGDRYQHVDELLVDLRTLATQSGSTRRLVATPSRRERRLTHALYSVGVLLVLALVSLGVVLWRQPGPPDEIARRFSTPFELTRPVISPDGRHIAYRSRGSLWVRDLNSETPREIPAGSGEGYSVGPTAPGSFYLTWSPDSRELVFPTPQQELRRVSVVEGGPATIVCKLPPVPLSGKGRGRGLAGMAWSTDGKTIVFSVYDPGGGIFEVPASGGSPTLLWKEPHADDLFLLDTPEGRAVVFATNEPDGHNLVVRTPNGERRIVANVDADFPELIYAPTGHILFRKNPRISPSIWAIRFSVDTLRAEGDAFPVAQSGQAMSLSQEGTLVYLDAGRKGHFLAWRDREGNVLSRASESYELIQKVSLSPDGSRAIVTATDNGSNSFWIYDLQRFLRTRFDPGRIVDGMRAITALWPRPGNEVVYALARFQPALSLDLLAKPPDEVGDGRRIPLVDNSVPIESSADGRYSVLLRGTPNRQEAGNIWLSESAASGGKREAVRLTRGSAIDSGPALSPNGRYLAYASRVGQGAWQLYVRPFPEGPGERHISAGAAPVWSADGTELFFVHEAGLMHTRVTTNGPFTASAPEPLFANQRLTALFVLPNYGVSPDGKRFLTVEVEQELAQPMMRVVENWLSEFRGTTQSRNR